MRNVKLYVAAILAVATSLAVFSCGNKNKQSDGKYNKDLDSSTREELNSIASGDDMLKGDLKNKTIKWMSTWDINPDSSGKNVPIELALFQERYGGNIKFYKVDWDNRYEKLTAAINAGEGIDFFPAGDMDAFPKGAVRGMFTPVDDYVDFQSPLWTDVKDVNDSLKWNGNHYVTVVSVTGDNCAVIYNKDTVAEAGLKDPAELYKNGNWNWNTFEDMLLKFVDTDNNKFGIDGWWFEFGLMNTTGVPPVTVENQKLVCNIGDPSMERVQNYLYDLYNKNCIAIGVGDYGWTDKPSYIGEGKLLFYPCGLYQFYCEPSQWKKTFGENAFFVPMPKDPDSDAYYIPTGMDAYVMVRNGQNPEGVARYLDCKRYTLLNNDVRAISDDQMFKDYGWTQEMVDMKNSMEDLAAANPTFDFSKGVSTDCGKLLDSNLRASARGTAWSETYASIAPTVELYIKEVNDNPIAYKDGDVKEN